MLELLSEEDKKSSNSKDVRVILEKYYSAFRQVAESNEIDYKTLHEKIENGKLSESPLFLLTKTESFYITKFY